MTGQVHNVPACALSCDARLFDDEQIPELVLLVTRELARMNGVRPTGWHEELEPLK